MIKWQKDLELGIRGIDNEHKMLLQALDEVYEACSRGEGLVKVKEVVTFLEWYVDKHFGDEERMQRKIAYPAYEHHIKNHRIYQARVKELVADLKNEEVTTEHIAKVTIYLQTMIREHILKDDKALAHYIKTNEVYKHVGSMPEAQVDPLTGLLAKDEFRNMMNQKIEAKSEARQLYVVITIDHFGDVNRTYGYDIGEEVIIYVGGILYEYQTEDILIGRNHQDEFVMFIEEREGLNVDQILDEISEKMYSGFKKAGSIIPLSLSMGIVEIYKNMPKKHIKQNGVIALKQAQQVGGNEKVYFDKQMYRQILRNSKIINQLQMYNANDALFMVYQPIFDLDSNKIKGVEALVRMRSEQGDIISPGEFIPLAEKNNLIVGIGYVCVRKVCQDFRVMLDQGIELDYISINLSIIQIRELDLVDKICQIAEEEKVPLHKLYFELTESVLVNDFMMITDTIRKLKAHGCKILLDDFGSGYSALAYLSRIDMDILKIDKTLIEGIGENAKACCVLNYAIKLAKELGMQTVVEGVETKEELEQLKTLYVDKIQGYYISRPLEPEKLINKLNEQKN